MQSLVIQILAHVTFIYGFIQTLKKAEEELRAADDMLAVKRKQLFDVEAQVHILKENLKKVEDEMASLKGQALLTENRLIRAGKLTAALGDEAVNECSTFSQVSNM